jgi:hypothetical protein
MPAKRKAAHDSSPRRTEGGAFGRDQGGFRSGEVGARAVLGTAARRIFRQPGGGPCDGGRRARHLATGESRCGGGPGRGNRIFSRAAARGRPGAAGGARGAGCVGRTARSGGGGGSDVRAGVGGRVPARRCGAGGRPGAVRHAFGAALCRRTGMAAPAAAHQEAGGDRRIRVHQTACFGGGRTQIA